MKKLFLLALVPALMFSFAGCKKETDEKPDANKPQVEVPEKNMSLTQKVTGTKCPPCGSWGWTMMDQLMDYGKGNSLFISTYSQNFVAEGFISTTATEMDKKWGITGYPTFVVNGVPRLARTQGVNVTQETQMCKDAVDEHKSAKVIANVGLEKSITDNTLNIKSSTKFFSDVNGEYKLALYIVEDQALWKQSGHPIGANSPIPHHYVLRNSVSGTWGETISEGDTKNGKFVDKNYTFELNSSWNKDKISVVGVIWKVDGNKFVFVNANKI